MNESMYPKCGKCGKESLLPFFGQYGWNIYGCTECGAVLKTNAGGTVTHASRVEYTYE